MKRQAIKEPLLGENYGHDDAEYAQRGNFNRDRHVLEGGYLDLKTGKGYTDGDDHGATRSQSGVSSAADAIVGLKQLESHGNLFQGLVKRVKICTGKFDEEGEIDPVLNVINIIITYDSQHSVALTTDERQEICQVQVYSLQTFDLVFQFEITGKDKDGTKGKGSWIVMNDVEQNYAGDVLCVPYSDNGSLRTLIFNNKGKKLANLKINDMFGIDDESKPIVGFYQPMLTACFVKDDDIFI